MSSLRIDGLAVSMLPCWCKALNDSGPDGLTDGDRVVKAAELGPTVVDDVVNLLLLLPVVRRCWTLPTPVFVKATDTSVARPLQCNHKSIKQGPRIYTNAHNLCVQYTLGYRFAPRPKAQSTTNDLITGRLKVSQNHRRFTVIVSTVEKKSVRLS